MAAMDNNSENKNPKISKLAIITIVSVVVLIVCVLVPYLNRRLDGPSHNILRCETNLHHLGLAFGIYAENNDDRYPKPDEWCDVIKQYGDANACLVCPAKKRTGERCSYAINPNAEPNSPADVVLVFETKGGWNQFGGPEILTTENHKPRGCSVLFADLGVKFIEANELDTLKWKADANDG